MKQSGGLSASRYYRNMIIYYPCYALQTADVGSPRFNAVYSAVQEVPLGHVTSYAHIARLLGQRMFEERIPF